MQRVRRGELDRAASTQRQAQRARKKTALLADDASSTARASGQRCLICCYACIVPRRSRDGRDTLDLIYVRPHQMHRGPINPYCGFANPPGGGNDD